MKFLEVRVRFPGFVWGVKKPIDLPFTLQVYLYHKRDILMVSGLSNTDIDMLEKRVFEAAVKLLEAAATVLPDDVEDALRRAYEGEDESLARGMLGAILKNVDIARNRRVPICQDTGTVIFYLKVGERFPLLGRLPEILRKATVEATKRVPLRPNAVHPFKEENSGDNTGRYIPWFEWEIVPDSDTAEITVVLKGGGSEAPTITRVLTPSQGLEGALKLVVDTIFKYGAKPCPPVIVSIGIGGTADIATKLMKKNFLRRLGQRHEDPFVAELEKKLLKAINMLEIGPHGVGGKITALDVFIDYAHRHPATFPVSVGVSCWATRKSAMRVHPDGRIEYLTHKFLNEGGEVSG